MLWRLLLMLVSDQTEDFSETSFKSMLINFWHALGYVPWIHAQRVYCIVMRHWWSIFNSKSGITCFHWPHQLNLHSPTDLLAKFVSTQLSTFPQSEVDWLLFRHTEEDPAHIKITRVQVVRRGFSERVYKIAFGRKLTWRGYWPSLNWKCLFISLKADRELHDQ